MGRVRLLPSTLNGNPGLRSLTRIKSKLSLPACIHTCTRPPAFSVGLGQRHPHDGATLLGAGASHGSGRAVRRAGAGGAASATPRRRRAVQTKKAEFAHGGDSDNNTVPVPGAPAEVSPADVEVGCGAIQTQRYSSMPWCQHCHAMLPNYAEACAQVGNHASLGQVNCIIALRSFSLRPARLPHGAALCGRGGGQGVPGRPRNGEFSRLYDRKIMWEAGKGLCCIITM